MSNLIIEVPVYCGARKVWRTLNLNTGTVYGTEHPTEQDAYNAIPRGEV